MMIVRAVQTIYMNSIRREFYNVIERMLSWRSIMMAHSTVMSEFIAKTRVPAIALVTSRLFLGKND